jgi:predicted oxidoreductase
MTRFKLAPNAPEVSALAYGVWRLADDSEGSSPARVRAKIDTCLELGITTFDHADIYGLYTCEGLFGAALKDAKHLRDQMQIVTKCCINVPCEKRPGTRLAHYDASASNIGQCVDRSLRELYTDRIDVLLIHRPDWLTNAADTAAGLQAVMKAGKVRSVGVSNYSTHQSALLAKYLGQAPVTNQVEINLQRMDAIYDGTLDQCQLNDSHPMAWSPLAGGKMMLANDEATVRLRAKLLALSQQYAVTPEGIAIAWIAALPSQPQVVIGTNQLSRIREAAAATAVKLERQHWYEIWEAAKGHSVP